MNADAPIAALIDRPPRVEMLIGIPTGPMSFSADDLRQVEQAAYNDGLSDGQSHRENWAIAGFVFGVVVTEGTFWMLALSAMVIGFGWLPIMVATAAVREVMRRRRA